MRSVVWCASARRTRSRLDSAADLTADLLRPAAVRNHRRPESAPVTGARRRLRRHRHDLFRQADRPFGTRWLHAFQHTTRSPPIHRPLPALLQDPRCRVCGGALGPRRRSGRPERLRAAARGFAAAEPGAARPTRMGAAAVTRGPPSSRPAASWLARIGSRPDPTADSGTVLPRARQTLTCRPGTGNLPPGESRDRLVTRSPMHCTSARGARRSTSRLSALLRPVPARQEGSPESRAVECTRRRARGLAPRPAGGCAQARREAMKHEAYGYADNRVVTRRSTDLPSRR